jgi:hypothetical protein
MAERVSTGGTKTFEYGKDYNPKLDEDRKKGIEEAYGKYYERKAREKKMRTIWIVVLIIVVLFAILGILFLR